MLKIKMYAIAIKHGKMTIEDVPEDERETVEALLASE